jgi:hypothetical protein
MAYDENPISKKVDARSRKLSPNWWRLLMARLMAKITCESHAHAAMMKKMIRSIRMTQAANAIATRRGEIVGMKYLAILTSLRQVTVIDVMIGMMIGAVNDGTIVVTIIVVRMEAVKVTGGTVLRGYLSYHLQSNYTRTSTQRITSRSRPICLGLLIVSRSPEILRISQRAGISTIQETQPPNPPPAPQHKVQQIQSRAPNEAFLPPQGQISMIHKTGISKREFKKLTLEINLTEVTMASIPEYIGWSEQSVLFSRADHPMSVPWPGHATH